MLFSTQLGFFRAIWICLLLAGGLPCQGLVTALLVVYRRPLAPILAEALAGICPSLQGPVR